MALEPARIINHYLIKQTEIPYLRKTFSVNNHNNICKKSKLNNILLNHVFSHVHPLKKRKKEEEEDYKPQPAVLELLLVSNDDNQPLVSKKMCQEW